MLAISLTEVISALHLIAWIHSTTNLKTFEQAKNLFNPGNIQSSSEESAKEKCKRLLECVAFSFSSILKYWIYVIDDIGVFTNFLNT